MDKYGSRCPLGPHGFDYSQAAMSAKIAINKERQLEVLDEADYRFIKHWSEQQIAMQQSLPVELFATFHSRKSRQEIEDNAGKVPTPRSKVCREWGQGGFS